MTDIDNDIEVQENAEATSEEGDNNIHTGAIEQFLTFTLGEEEYGVGIMGVREIKAWTETTRLPNSPDYMRGVMNLRGAIIPIFDLRTRFDMGITEVTEKHVVIILAVGERTIGILVDTVSDILEVRESQIKPPPEMKTGVSDEYLAGLISVEERMVTILDVEGLFSEETLQSVDELKS